MGCPFVKVGATIARSRNELSKALGTNIMVASVDDDEVFDERQPCLCQINIPATIALASLTCSRPEPDLFTVTSH